jgi:RimJ/RimL family protein N-acetyltransferase
MQRSWRTDCDKLTFIACLPLEPLTKSGDERHDKERKVMVAGNEDGEDRLIGDVNLFLTPADEDEEGCIGELELMIAPASLRRRGYGRAAILTFLCYIERHLDEILEEYRIGVATSEAKMKLLMLRVKIGGKNEKSIRLFEGIGFVKTGEGENWFGEVELVFEGAVGKGRIQGLMERFGVEGYREVVYVDEAT